MTVVIRPIKHSHTLCMWIIRLICVCGEQCGFNPPHRFASGLPSDTHVDRHAACKGVMCMIHGQVTDHPGKDGNECERLGRCKALNRFFGLGDDEMQASLACHWSFRTINIVNYVSFPMMNRSTRIPDD